jgi:hypothetical protein
MAFLQHDGLYIYSMHPINLSQLIRSQKFYKITIRPDFQLASQLSARHLQH